MAGKTQNPTNHLSVGMVNFINTAPIYIPWQEIGTPSKWRVVEGSPAYLNRLLELEKLDAGLVSSYAYGRRRERYLLLPDIGISATGPVGSVILFSTVSPEKLDGGRIYITHQSATSRNLLKIILEDFWGIRPRYEGGSFQDMKAGSQPAAYLAIGDEALRLRKTCGRLQQLDLADVWLKETGLPFVFAVAAVRKESCKRYPHEIKRLHRHVRLCYEKGRRNLERISRLSGARIPMSSGECLNYLEGIEFDLSGEKQRGLLLFFRLLHERGDFPEVKRLNFINLAAIQVEG